MSYTPVSAETFGGLNLVDDPGTLGWNGAVDLLNVDFDRRGRIRSRDGCTVSFSSVRRYASLFPFYRASGSVILLAQEYNSDGSFSSLMTAWTQAGVKTSNATSATVVSNYPMQVSWARYGTPAAETIFYVTHYALGSNGSTLSTFRSYDGTTFNNAPTGALACAFLAVTPSDNRLVAAKLGVGTGGAAGANASSVKFSDAGDPTTWGANNYVDMTPGDGEAITGMVSWRELLFVFKESKFFVFYGTETDSSGNPIFKYRTINTGTGAGQGPGFAATSQILAAPEGVYFVNPRGIWRTTGAEPLLVSHAMDPLFLGGSSSFYTGGAVNQTYLYNATLAWHKERLYFGYPSGSSQWNDRTLVFDPRADAWMLWDIGAHSFVPFQFADGANDVAFVPNGLGGAAIAAGVGRLSSSYTTDNGTAITSRYRAGFADLGSPDQKTVREWLLEGSGSPTFKTSYDWGSLETGSAVTLGTSPATAQSRRRYAVRGRQFSWQVGGTSAWTLNNLTANIREKRSPGLHG